MTRVERIETEIEQFSDEELIRFREWYDAFEARRFDHAIEADAQAGRLDSLADEALGEFQAGRTRSF
ncbi:hypothetical protein [Jiella mangrovi]|uniref:Uncharacterized protein n=1 Tax=Jiella mangrovi TaxID=2821407 RepID=A0ABS4BFA2_9HYPH|nr:hypothetical protein [Jiella mangrovi]MBP0614841.1 hypothetical protein [Jiella mangrovi]